MSDLAVIKDYMRSEPIKANFAELVGDHNVAGYITSVLLAVANDEYLQKCTPQSIYTSAIRAATLRLSCDQSLGQAYLVAYGQKATLIVGYKGLHDLAVRTGQYRYINVGPVYEGEEVIEDRIKGWHSLKGQAVNRVIIGWLAAFELFTGYAKTIYKTVDEIHEHARKYSKSYDNPKGLWKKDPHSMERKTVLRELLTKWGKLDPTAAQVLHEIEQETGDNGWNVIEGEEIQPDDNDPSGGEHIPLEIVYPVLDSEYMVSNPTVNVTTTTTVSPADDPYSNVRGSKGELYSELSLEDLTYRFNATSKAIDKYKDKVELTEAELGKLNDALIKHDAAAFYIELKKAKA